MTGFGVRRLVAVNSGGYRFADVALEGPIHLVAPNNRGKSTLVNALQFLYVDELRAMRFPRSVDETREHYFGRSPSYLLFECHTASGPQSLLVVGRGRVAGSTFARFVFAGGYQAEDFKDAQGRVVEFEVLKTRLANRSLQEVKPSELWESLCNPARRGRPEDNGHRVPHMGLLPIRTREDYRSFREAYVRLLSLSDMSAAELRLLLIACHAAEVGDIKLDVAADYRDEFERAERTESRLAFLDAAGHLIDDGERARGRVESCRSRFDTSASATLTEYVSLLAALRDGETAVSRAEKELDTRQAELNDARSDASRREGRLLGDVDRIEKELVDLDALHAKWSVCTGEMIQTMQDNADAGRDRIAAQRERIRQAGAFDLGAMQRSVRSLRHDAESHERSLANWEKQLSGWLASHGVKPDTIVQAFSILNPALLRLIVGIDIVVSDPQGLVTRIDAITDRIENGQYEDEFARAALSSVNRPDTRDLKDPEAAKESLRIIKGRLEEELNRLAVAEDSGRARAELEEMERAHGDLAKRLDEHAAYLTRWKARPDRERSLTLLSDELSSARADLRAVRSKEERLSADRRALSDDMRTWRVAIGEIQAASQRFQSACDAAQLTAPTDAGDPDQPSEISGQDVRGRVAACVASLDALAGVAREYRSAREDVRSLQRQLTRFSQEHKQPQYFIGDEDADWFELVDARRATAELHQANQQAWDTLFTTIRARLDALMRGYRAIGNAITKLNSAMRRHRVSNLREVQLEVVRQHEACDLLESLTGSDGLFADRESLDRARDRLRRWIKEGKIIRLDDLFAVRIRVQGVDGQWGEAKSLDDIGSTGTGMTAKAMIFIHLVRAVVADERYRLHFYLDETGQLDDSNLAATTALAMERGVVPITAEPRVRVEPLAHPTVTVYSLGQDSEGLFYIDAHRTLRVARRQTVQEPTPDVAGSA